MEPFKDFPQMGRFTLRDEGKTIAMGKVLRVVEWLPKRNQNGFALHEFESVSSPFKKSRKD